MSIVIDSYRAKVLRGACPTFFRALCATASEGGASNYSAVGFTLTRHVEDLAPYEMDDDAWKERVDDLRRLLRRRADDGEIVGWFDDHLPRCMALVPARRRSKFVEGVRAYFNEEGF